MVTIVLLACLTAGTAYGLNPIGRQTAKTGPSAVSKPVPAGQNTFFERSTGMEFVWLKGGCFQMGSPMSERNRDMDEGPVHQVCVNGYYIGKYEVTNGQYRRKMVAHDSGEYNGQSLNGDRQPVLNISWNDAAAYARWLSQQTGMSFRLPTEAEWEYAARGGTSTAMPWGNNPDAACAFANVFDLTSKRINTAMTLRHHNCNDGFAVTAPVGSLQANSFGLHDMLGNAWECSGDWYRPDYYSYSPGQDPKGPGAGNTRVLRGGSWSNEPGRVRVANRGNIAPGKSDNLLSFRLVLDAR